MYYSCSGFQLSNQNKKQKVNIYIVLGASLRKCTTEAEKLQKNMWHHRKKERKVFFNFWKYIYAYVDPHHWWHSTKTTVMKQPLITLVCNCRSVGCIPDRSKFWLFEQCFTSKLLFAKIQTCEYFTHSIKMFLTLPCHLSLSYNGWHPALPFFYLVGL